MAKITLKYLITDIDRHGNTRRYVRIPGRPKVRIREQIGTPEFMSAYQRALETSREELPQFQKAAAGTFRALCILYYASSAFSQLDQSTKNWRRHHLDLIAQ